MNFKENDFLIPKILHYCWFGGNPLPPIVVSCIESWKIHLPDYTIVEWNEDNFDINLYRFAKEAYENKKYAFVSDVCRLHVLKYCGGIYLDTDVEIVKPLDLFLHHNAFSGFESPNFVPTAIMGSEKNSKWICEMLEYYDNRSFLLSNGNLDIKTNTQIITDLMVEKGFVMDNSFQEIPEYVTFYPTEFFCPKSYDTGKIEKTQNTYSIHHFAGSWKPKYQVIEKKIWDFFKMPDYQVITRVRHQFLKLLK